MTDDVNVLQIFLFFFLYDITKKKKNRHLHKGPQQLHSSRAETHTLVDLTLPLLHFLFPILVPPQLVLTLYN